MLARKARLRKAPLDGIVSCVNRSTSLSDAVHLTPAKARTSTTSTILRKALTASTGLLMTGWAFLHMAGSLGVFAGADTMNEYAQLLRRFAPLNAMRVGLVLLLLAHAYLALRLALRSRRARTTRYRRQHPVRSTWFGRRMALSGSLVLAWLCYHVAHMYGPASPSYVPGDVHHNLVVGLASPLVATSYVLAAVLFALHLRHGLTSVLTTAGLAGRLRQRGAAIATAAVALLTLGFVAPPVAALAGYWR